MRIVVFDVEAWETEAFAALREREGVEVHLVQEPLRTPNASRYADAQIISGFVYSQLDRPVLEQMTELKLIATRSTGADHIDLDYCRERGIRVANVPTYGTHTVAEHAFGLLLTLSHRLVEAIDRTRKGDFSSRGLQGFDLNGKTLGIVGAGDIGKQAARIGRGFDMRVIVYDVKEDHEAAREIGYEHVPFHDLLAQSDVVSLHVPGTERTRHMIGADEFARMKDGVVLINTARGSVVDVQALVRAIAEGKVGGAGLDVLPEEPVIREEAELLRSIYERQHNLDVLLANHVLTHLRNVVVTPHSAFNTREAVMRILETTVQNIEAFLEGRPDDMASVD